jgi:hypothetical protein
LAFWRGAGTGARAYILALGRCLCLCFGLGFVRALWVRAGAPGTSRIEPTSPSTSLSGCRLGLSPSLSTSRIGALLAAVPLGGRPRWWSGPGMWAVHPSGSGEFSSQSQSSHTRRLVWGVWDLVAIWCSRHAAAACFEVVDTIRVFSTFSMRGGRAQCGGVFAPSQAPASARLTSLPAHAHPFCPRAGAPAGGCSLGLRMDARRTTHGPRDEGWWGSTHHPAVCFSFLRALNG